VLSKEQRLNYEPFRDLLRKGVQLRVWPGPPSPVLAVRLHGSGCTDAELERLIAVKTLRHLVLHHAPVSNAGVRHLKQMIGLQKLWLTRTEIDDAGIAELHSALPGLNIEK
jgi:hypothetical protein